MTTKKIILGILSALSLALAAEVASQPNIRFAQTNLVSSGAQAAAHIDSDLINPWGVVAGPDGFFWVANNGSGKATLYTPAGVKSSLVVTIPDPAAAGTSAPTGEVFNPASSDFLGDSFIFATEGGTIVGWQAGVSGVIRSDQSGTGAVYKGLALAKIGTSQFLYAADFRNNKIDVFDSNYSLVPAASLTRFADPSAPAGYAPFNVHTVGSRLFVTYAKQDSDQTDDVAGAGNGFINVFKSDGAFVKRFATGTSAGGNLRQLDAPWGIAVGPKAFGAFSGHILVGNFGSGRIAVFTRGGRFVDFLTSRSNNPIEIDGLWEIFFRQRGTGDAGKLYFSAGPDDETGGLLGYVAVSTSAARRPAAGRPTAPPAPASASPIPTRVPTQGGYYQE